MSLFRDSLRAGRLAVVRAGRLEFRLRLEPVRFVQTFKRFVRSRSAPIPIGTP